MTEGHTGRLEAALDGKYRIERKLGEGGMASVYLAEDIKHHRKVALKILKPELAAVIGAERFLSEIRTTANLQHPHILALFDSGEAGGYLYYVMPYIEGETLREKLEREKQLGVDESIRIARDVADALDYAHRQGVIHRDIKPANILLHDGRPVVADFGIALAVAQAGGGRMTATGLSLGTPHYMSPEQASADRDLSARSDVYSLGCVLYEMIGGQPPHTGPSAQSILVHILTEEATPLTKLRHTVPPHVAATVSKAIEKLPADRFETAKAFMDALADSSFTYQARPGMTAPTQVAATAAAGPAQSVYRDSRFVAAVLIGATMTALAAWGWLRPTAAPDGVTTRVALTSTADLAIVPNSFTMAISPDGTAMITVRGSPPALYLRTADDPEWRPLPNTVGAVNPTFSPDGQSVAFSTVGGTILKVPVTGGPALLIASPGANPHWGAPDAIVYDDLSGGAINRVSAAGGEPDVLLGSDAGFGARRPFLLPNGKGVVFATETGGGDPLNSRIMYLEIETGEVRELVASGTQPRYVPTGHLLYGHGSQALMGVPFDADRGEVTGDPTILLPLLAVRGGGAAEFAVSENGTLIYDPTAADDTGGGAQRLLVEVDLEGVANPIPLSPAPMDTPRYSPDGSKIAYASGAEIRVYDVVTGANPGFGNGSYPVWSPGGEYIYHSVLSPTSPGFRRPADGREERTQLWARATGTYVTDVSADDSIIVVRENAGAGRGHDLLLMREGPDSAVFTRLLTAEWNESNGNISPDERWIAYQSDENGEYRIYVHSFPVITGRHSVSPGLGTEPVWAPDGRTLYYRSDTRFLAVDVATGPTFEVRSTPRVLFDRPEYTNFANAGSVRTWDIHPDGSRFVMVATPTEAGGGIVDLRELYIVTNWFTELRERMGEN